MEILLTEGPYYSYYFTKKSATAISLSICHNSPDLVDMSDPKATIQ